MMLRSRQMVWGVLLGLVVASATLAPRAEAAAKVYFCTSEGGTPCLCIDWDGPASTYIEVRCPSAGESGFTTDPNGHLPPGYGGGGGWQGPGGGQTSDNPGKPTSGELTFAINNAKSIARLRLKGDSECCLAGKPYNVPNECTKLFVGNPLGMLGAGLLDNYVNFRDGTGVHAPDGTVPCNSGGTAMWTTCCAHDPDVMVCSSYKNLGVNDAAAIMIHEVLHVAGQPEDATPGIGPGDFPTTNEITQRVKDACNL